MLTTSTRRSGLALVLTLSGFVFTGPLTATPPAETPAETPAGTPTEGGAAANSGHARPDDVLKGPTVPPADVKGERPFIDPKAGRLSKPMIEQRAFFIALESMQLAPERRAKFEELRAAWVDRVAAFERESSVKRRALEAARKKAAPNQPPSEEFRKSMDEIEKARPKLHELRETIALELSEEEVQALEKRFQEEMKRIRDEITRRTEAERAQKKRELDAKKAEEEQEKRSKQRGGGGDGAGDEMGSSSSDEMSESPKGGVSSNRL